MSNSLSGWDDTITAIATPPGVGAIGVIRMSGDKAFEIINKIFPSKDILLQASHTLHVGLLKTPEEILDEVVLSVYRSPHSFTGENVIEISCHGSQFVQQKILQKLIAYGARIAKPGEFTQRAFLNGKLDLAQAEAIADLIASNTEASQKAALQNMRGGFSKELKVIREELLKFSALIELELDFSQEDVEFADRKKLFELLEDALIKVKTLIDSFGLGNVIKNGVQVAIIGKPNAGKSTLLNTLLNEDRAIVSEIEGTTRDTVEEIINIGGIFFKLIDTAGIRNQTKDEIETIGVAKSLEKMRLADIVLYLFDVNRETISMLEERIKSFEKDRIKFLLVANKTDILTDEFCSKFSSFKDVTFISAKENKNIAALKTSLFKAAVDEEFFNKNVIVTNVRHIEALQKAFNSLEEVKTGMNSNLPGDLLALDIRSCLHFIGDITGEINNEEKLDYIFSKFCIGK